MHNLVTWDFAVGDGLNEVEHILLNNAWTPVEFWIPNATVQFVGTWDWSMPFVPQNKGDLLLETPAC